MTGSLWKTVYDDLRTRITTGQLHPGDQVPPELKLATQYQVSRQTARRALSQLQQEGLITPGRGSRGRTVRYHRPLRWQLSRFEAGVRRDDTGIGMDEWAAEVSEQGRTPRQTVQASIQSPTEEVSEALQIPEGGLVVCRERIRHVDGIPYQLSKSYFPESIGAGTVLMQQGDVVMPGGILKSIGHPQHHARDEITVRMPTPDEVDQLHLTNGTPVGVHTRTGYGKDGNPVRYMNTVFPGDKHYLVYELEL